MMQWDCNSIEWLVDILGTDAILQNVVDNLNGGPEGAVKNRDESSKATEDYRAKEDGLYFYKGHWVGVRKGEELNSYVQKFQRPGTAHFCQTFALMMFTGVDSQSKYQLKSGKYGQNIEKAMQFWIDYFEAYPREAERVCDEEIKRDVAWRNKIPDGENYYLKNITPKRLIAFLKKVKDTAQKFVSCKQG